VLSLPLTCRLSIAVQSVSQLRLYGEPALIVSHCPHYLVLLSDPYTIQKLLFGVARAHATSGRLTFILSSKQSSLTEEVDGMEVSDLSTCIKIFELINLLLHNTFHRGHLFGYGSSTVRLDGCKVLEPQMRQDVAKGFSFPNSDPVNFFPAMKSFSNGIRWR